MKLKKSIPLMIAMALLLPFVLATAGEYSNTRALFKISSVKVYYDVNIGIADKLTTRLMLIDKTYNQLVKAGVQSEFVVGFRGKATSFVTKGDDYVFEEELTAKRKVHEWVRSFKSRGIIVEQCLIAAGLQRIDPEDFLPEIEIVENGYISMIGYQAKGYSQVPMD